MARKSSIKPRFILRTLEDSVPALDQQLLTAYIKTDYRVAWPPGLWTSLRINQSISPFFSWLEQAGFRQFALITAYNPLSESQEENINEMQDELLGEALKQPGWQCYRSLHLDPDKRWPPEKGYCCCGIGAATAVTLGRKFRQNALVWWAAGSPLELWWL